MQDILELILITFAPLLELRASIPYGIIVKGMSWPAVFLVCVLANIVIAAIAYFFLDKIILLFRKMKWVDRLYSKYIERIHRKSHKYVEKYGELGLALFIAIPLPGSGVYSGSLAAEIFGIDFKTFMKAAFIGVVIAGILVTIITMTGMNGMSLFIKHF